MPPELLPQDGHEERRGQDGRRHARPALLDVVDHGRPDAGDVEVVGPGRRRCRAPRERRSGPGGTSAGRTGVPATRYQTASLSTSAHGSTVRVETSAGPARRRSASPAADGPRRPAARRPTAAGPARRTPTRPGRRRPRGRPPRRPRGTSPAARGRACAGRRSRRRTGRTTSPTSRNSAWASDERQPGQVGPRAADQRPPAAAPGLRVDGDAGGRQRLEVATGRRHRHLELGRHLGGGDPAARLHEQEGGHQPVCAHVPRIANKVLRR